MLPNIIRTIVVEFRGRESKRLRARVKWQQQQDQQGHFSGTAFNGVFSSSSSSSSSSSLQQQFQHQHQHHSQGSMMMIAAADSGGSSLSEVVAQSSIKPAPGGLNLNQFQIPTAPSPSASGFDVNSSISRTFSCPPALAQAKKGTVFSIGKESFKKRKSEKAQNHLKVVAENDNKDKRIKVVAEDGESKITGQPSTKNNTNSNSNNKQNCADKENSKASEVQKPDYIHVRARRGQATDSHSLAERVRREKISERMKYLQDLVPGCNKITGKAGMLDEIINYVQSLQRQVEFLSMKLAAVNPRLDFNVDDLFDKEVFPTCDATFPIPAMGMSSSDIMNNHPAFLQFNSPQQIVPYGGLESTGMNPSDMGLRRTISAPVSMPETFLDSSCFSQILPSTTWEGDFQNLYNLSFDQPRATTSFPCQLFTGLVEASNLKMEM